MLDPRPSPSFHFPSTPKGVFIPPFIPRQGAFGGQMCRPNRSPMSGRRACFSASPTRNAYFRQHLSAGGLSQLQKWPNCQGHSAFLGSWSACHSFNFLVVTLALVCWSLLAYSLSFHAFPKIAEPLEAFTKFHGLLPQKPRDLQLHKTIAFYMQKWLLVLKSRVF